MQLLDQHRSQRASPRCMTREPNRCRGSERRPTWRGLTDWWSAMKSAAGVGPLHLRTEECGSLCAAPASKRRGWRAVGDSDNEGAPRVGRGRRTPDASRSRICVGTSPGKFRESPTLCSGTREGRSHFQDGSLFLISVSQLSRGVHSRYSWKFRESLPPRVKPEFREYLPPCQLFDAHPSLLRWFDQKKIGARRNPTQHSRNSENFCPCPITGI